VVRPELRRSKSEPTWGGVGNSGISDVFDSGSVDNDSVSGASVVNGDNDEGGGLEISGTEGGIVNSCVVACCTCVGTDVTVCLVKNSSTAADRDVADCNAVVCEAVVCESPEKVLTGCMAGSNVGGVYVAALFVWGVSGVWANGSVSDRSSFDPFHHCERAVNSEPVLGSIFSFAPCCNCASICCTVSAFCTGIIAGV